KLDYAKGLFVHEYRGLRAVEHGGAWGGYRAQLLRFPEQHFSVACLCNLASANPGRRAYRVADVYLGALLKEKQTDSRSSAEREKNPAMTLPGEQLRGLDGDYHSDELNVTYKLAVEGGTLKLKELGGSTSFVKKGILPGDSFSALGKDNFT